MTKIKHGKSYWKHYNSLLTDPDYLKPINKKIIDDIKSQYAIPVYNREQINGIPNEELQLVVNDQLLRLLITGNTRRMYII